MNILKDKSYKNYDYFSRYSSFPIYYNTYDRKYVYGMTSQIDDDIVYVLHKVKTGETLDSIALHYYNNPTYYWALASFNHINDAFSKLEIDSYIKIPTLTEIKFKG